MKSKKLKKAELNNDGNSWDMWRIPLFGRGIEEVLKRISSQLTVTPCLPAGRSYELGKKPFWIATVNPEFMMAARKDAGFRVKLLKTDLNVMDGIGLIWAKQLLITNYELRIKKIYYGLKIGMEILLGKHKENLVTGADLMDRMCQLAEVKNKTVYFYGGWGERAKKTAEYFVKKYPKLKVAGWRAEDFDFKTEADILFVARGMKKQEEWIDQNGDKLKVKVVMGVGRSFDYYSGELKRAPGWMRKMGLEWLYSLLKEPKRWRRQLQLPRFVWVVLFN